MDDYQEEQELINRLRDVLAEANRLNKELTSRKVRLYYRFGHNLSQTQLPDKVNGAITTTTRLA